MFGIGTNLVTCQAQPALGMVYKICSLKDVPRIKISEESEKTTIPGMKCIVRAYQDDIPVFDVLCLHSEVDSFCNQFSPIDVYTQAGQKITKEFSQLECISQLLYPNSQEEVPLK